MNLSIVDCGYFDSYKNSICSADCSIKSLAAKASCVVFPIFIVLAVVFALMDNYSAAQQNLAAKQIAFAPGSFDAPGQSGPAPLAPPPLGKKPTAQAMKGITSAPAHFDKPGLEPLEPLEPLAPPPLGKKLSEEAIRGIMSAPAMLVAPDSIKVALRGARQYDMPGNKPAACTFHAFQAIRVIAANFDLLAGMINREDGANLSKIQRRVIEAGLIDYSRALRQNSKLVEGADLDHLRPLLSKEIQMGSSLSVVFTPGAPSEDLTKIADHLFSAGGPTKAIWVKNPNDESFALIGNGNQVILFDSHYNEIQMLFTKEQLVNALQQKVSIDPQINLFDYALGTV